LPAGSADFADRLARTLLESHQTGRPLQVRLHPPELGLLQIELSSRDGAFTARLDVETPAARQAVLEQLPQLREALAQNGHTLERVDVQVLERSEHQPRHHNHNHHPSDQQPQDDPARDRPRNPRQRPGLEQRATRGLERVSNTGLERLDIQI
jgi:flagellar hook-length control protein FliK